MASILMCDSCGEISTDMGSKVFIQVNPRRMLPPLAQEQNTRDMQRNGYEKDFCFSCTDKLLKPRVIKMLTADIEKDL